MYLRLIIVELKISDTQILLEKCLGFSLSDQYWIFPDGSALRWEQVFFDDTRFDVKKDIAYSGKSEEQI